MRRSKMIIAFVLIILISSQGIYADNTITVFVDNVQVQFDVMPTIENGRTLVPMRPIFEALGATEIQWDNETKTAAAYKGDTGVAVQVGNTTANINNNAVTLDVPPKVIKGRTMVPLRFIGEAFDCTVSWDSKSRTITIVSKDYKEPNNVSDNIVGFWSNSIFSNSIVDAATGVPIDNYTGTWYTFREDGTFANLITGAGLIVSGSAIETGNYTVNDGAIKFYDIKQSWYPKLGAPNSVKEYKNKTVPDKEGTYEIKDDNQTLVIKLTFTNSFKRVQE